MIIMATAFFGTSFMVYNEPIISNVLISRGFSENLIGKTNFFKFVGYLFAAGCLSYAISSPMVGIANRFISKIWIIQIAFLICGIFMFFQGPSSPFNFAA